MIDTVILEVGITNPATQALIDTAKFDLWEPNLSTVLNSLPLPKGIHAETATLNPTKSEKLSGYKPRLTVTKWLNPKGGFKYWLRIEFSVQKLLYGNNYQEVDDTDFDAICSKLEQFLKAKGITLPAAQIKLCPCKTVHYAKNCIYAKTKVGVHSIIFGLFKANFNVRHAISLKQYPQGGLGLVVGIPSRTLEFYDKNAELAKSTKRGDQPTLTKAHLRKINRQQTLRVELKLQKPDQIRRTLNLCGFATSSEPRFQEVFSVDKAKAALLSELDQIQSNWFQPVRLNSALNAKVAMDTTAALSHAAMSEVVAAGLIASQYGAREARLLCGRRWAKIFRDGQKLTIPPDPWLGGVIEQITNFKLIKTI